MTRSMWLSTHARRLSQQPGRRFLSTSRPATRLSAFSVGEIVPRRKTVVASASLSRPSVTRPLISCSRLRAPVASFSSSSVRPATKVTQNPRAGDDGETLMINISPRAVERLRDITDPSSSPQPLKMKTPTTTFASRSPVVAVMVFSDEAEGAPANAAGEAKVVMDEPSLELLSGSTVDYTTELIGSQFTIVDNPRATSNCGCGTSFDVMD
ncbi:FeS cluster insertion protein [Penicillium frequentans]|nr:FeS cluster insertion protein [Penicillium glabrum]